MTTVCIGIGGTSCSGKTTVSRILRDKCPQRSIVFSQDEWFRLDSEVEAVDGRKDWDCPEALRMDDFYAHVLKEKNSGDYDLIIVEGFLLFVDERVTSLFDHAFLLDISYQKLVERRSGRMYPVSGAVDEWWQDPPGYIEEVVYPNYLKYHGLYLQDSGEWDGAVYKLDVTDKTIDEVVELINELMM